jgi:AraC-like DNA-binding protein
VQYVELEPCAALRGRVRYWRLCDPADGAAAPDAHAFEPVLPDGCVELVVHLGDPFWLERDGRAERQAPAVLGGPTSAPVRLRPGGRADVIGVRFAPGAARGVAGVPLAELANALPELAAVAGPLARGLAEELAEPRRGEGWTDVLDRRLAPLVAAPARIDPLVHALRTSGGRAPVAALADRAGLSTRQLERLFEEHIGLGPKLYARLVRFQRALALVRGTRAPLAAVAARAGYFDQAHLTRDFRRFAGKPPAALRATAPGLADHFVGRG